MKKALSILILCSMTLHCASRLGVLDLIYKSRHQIAVALGILEEIPISTCSSDFDFNQKIETGEDTSAVPVAFHAQEIQLFFPQQPFSLSHHLFSIDSKSGEYPVQSYSSPSLEIFQPPKV